MYLQDTCTHDCAFVCIQTCTWSRLCVHIPMQMTMCMCAYVHTRVGMIAPMCAYTCRHDRAYVCTYVQAWLCLCAHIRAGMIMPYVCIFVQAWLHLCVHTGVGMITRGHDHAYVCIFMQAWLRLCVHTGVGMIVPMCAYTCMPDCTYVTCGLVGMKILRANKTRPNVSNLRDLTLCMHICVQACICTILGHKVRHQVWVFMTTIRLGLETAMPWAQKASEQQCRSQAITPRLSGWDARWCTNKQLSAEREGLGLCTLGKFLYDNLACMWPWPPGLGVWIWR